MCPFSSLAFPQPTTVDKEPFYFTKTIATMQKSNGKSVTFFGDKGLLSQTLPHFCLEGIN